MTNSVSPSAVKELAGSDGTVFARIYHLTDGSVAALTRKVEDGKASFVLFMEALGIQSVSNLDPQEGVEFNPQQSEAFLQAVDLERVESMSGMLKKTIREKLPEFSSMFHVQGLLRDLDPSLGRQQPLVKTCEHDGRPFLFVRLEERSLGATKSSASIEIFGSDLNSKVPFASVRERDLAFSSSERLSALVESVLKKSNDLDDSKVTPSRKRVGP